MLASNIVKKKKSHQSWINVTLVNVINKLIHLNKFGHEEPHEDTKFILMFEIKLFLLQ